MNLKLWQKNVGTPRITRDYLIKINEGIEWPERTDKICSFIWHQCPESSQKWWLEEEIHMFPPTLAPAHELHCKCGAAHSH